MTLISDTLYIEPSGSETSDVSLEEAPSSIFHMDDELSLPSPPISPRKQGGVLF